MTGPLCGLILISSALVAQESYRVVKDVPIGTHQRVEVQSLSDGSFAVGLSTGAQGEVRGLDGHGNWKWRTDLRASLIGMQPARGRLLATTVEEGGRLSAHVIDERDGTIVRSFQAWSDMVIDISSDGDAVALFAKSFESPANEVEVRRVSNGDSWTLNLGGPVGYAIPLDYENVVVLMDNGRLDHTDRIAAVKRAIGGRAAPAVVEELATSSGRDRLATQSATGSGVVVLNDHLFVLAPGK